MIGNDILLSNPYGSTYKIHGCVKDPTKIIITSSDYSKFNSKYELIRAQLLSIFIHNPIVFLGYGIGDENIKNLLKTIFTYVEPNSEDAQKIRNNFLLVEYEAGSESREICEHDIDLEGFSTIRINKIKTDNFKEIYQSISELTLPISAMDIRKVQNIVREIYSGGSINVKITEDLDSLNNSDKILAIGSSKTIQYQYQTAAEMMSNYFNILDESNSQILSLIDKYTLQSKQYFPIFAFSKINKKIAKSDHLKDIQTQKIQDEIRRISTPCQVTHSSIEDIHQDASIADGSKLNAIFWATYKKTIPIKDVESLLRSMPEKRNTQYRKLLCLYDIIAHSNIDLSEV